MGATSRGGSLGGAWAGSGDLLAGASTGPLGVNELAEEPAARAVGGHGVHAGPLLAGDGDGEYGLAALSTSHIEGVVVVGVEADKDDGPVPVPPPLDPGERLVSVGASSEAELVYGLFHRVVQGDSLAVRTAVACALQPGQYLHAPSVIHLAAAPRTRVELSVADGGLGAVELATFRSPLRR